MTDPQHGQSSSLVHIRCDRCGGSNLHTLREVFEGMNPEQRQLLTCALAGNHPEHLAHLRPEILRALAQADGLLLSRESRSES